MRFPLLHFRKVAGISPPIQISILVVLYCLTLIVSKRSLDAIGLLFGYPLTSSFGILFAPIYEELLFRGIIFHYLLKETSFFKAVIISSLLFGLWHLKNLVLIDPYLVMQQVLFTAIIFGPLLCLIAYKAHTIWIGSIIHYFHNLALFDLYYMNAQ